MQKLVRKASYMKQTWIKKIHCKCHKNSKVASFQIPVSKTIYNGIVIEIKMNKAFVSSRQKLNAVLCEVPLQRELKWFSLFSISFSCHKMTHRMLPAATVFNRKHRPINREFTFLLLHYMSAILASCSVRNFCSLWNAVTSIDCTTISSRCKKKDMSVTPHEAVHSQWIFFINKGSRMNQCTSHDKIFLMLPCLSITSPGRKCFSGGKVFRLVAK